MEIVELSNARGASTGTSSQVDNVGWCMIFSPRLDELEYPRPIGGSYPAVLV